MKLPDFFDEIPRLCMHDPLAETLGCAEGGLLEYGYADAVRLTGHSCPTVAAAYWLTWRALAELYPGAIPERGRIKVEFRDDVRTGSNGVVANVVQMLTGAGGSTGFKGIGGRYARVGLLRFAPGLPLSLRFTRLDDGTSIDAAAALDLPTADPEMAPLLARCAKGSLDSFSMRRLGVLWQARVRHLLLDLAYDPAVFVIRRVESQRDACLAAIESRRGERRARETHAQ
ncbi:MAG: hypothetical protein ABI156_09560 [Caldimonas sp.]